MAVTVVPRLLAGLTGGAEVSPLEAEIWRGGILFLPSTPSCASLQNVFTREVLNPNDGRTAERSRLRRFFEASPARGSIVARRNPARHG
jgi:maltooligosyltrehalose synthase